MGLPYWSRKTRISGLARPPWGAVRIFERPIARHTFPVWKRPGMIVVSASLDKLCWLSCSNVKVAFIWCLPNGSIGSCGVVEGPRILAPPKEDEIIHGTDSLVQGATRGNGHKHPKLVRIPNSTR